MNQFIKSARYLTPFFLLKLSPEMLRRLTLSLQLRPRCRRPLCQLSIYDVIPSILIYCWLSFPSHSSLYLLLCLPLIKQKRGVEKKKEASPTSPSLIFLSIEIALSICFDLLLASPSSFSNSEETDRWTKKKKDPNSPPSISLSRARLSVSSSNDLPS